MSLEERTKNHLDQIRNRNKNGYKREDHLKRMNKRSTQYTRESVTNDHINKTNLQRHNLKERLDEEKQDSNDVRT